MLEKNQHLVILSGGEDVKKWAFSNTVGGEEIDMASLVEMVPSIKFLNAHNF